jgi:hypothetical protein
VTSGRERRSTGVIRLLPVLLALVLAGCGGDDDEQAAQPAPAAGPVKVEVTHAGAGNGVFHCGEGCDEQQLAAALKRSRDKVRACTEIYGGPETAHVTGTLGGSRVDASITRNDGCGIADYEAVFAALGVDPPIRP